MIWNLAGAGLSAGLGAFMAARENKKMRKALDAAESRNRMNYWDDVGLLERNKGWALRRVQEQNEKMNRGVNSSAVSTGMTNENRLAAMQNAGNIYADAVNTATAQQTGQQMEAKRNYEANQNAIDRQRQQLGAQKAQAWSQLGSNLAGSIIDAGVASEWLKKPAAEAGAEAAANAAAEANAATTGVAQTPLNIDWLRNSGIISTPSKLKINNPYQRLFQ